MRLGLFPKVQVQHRFKEGVFAFERKAVTREVATAVLPVPQDGMRKDQSGHQQMHDDRSRMYNDSGYEGW